MYNYYRDNMQTMPMQAQYNPMMAMPMQNMYNPMMATMPMQNMYNPAAAMPTQFDYNTMAYMTDEDLEKMYPQTYNIIQPVVENECDKWMGKYGDKCPCKADVEAMANEIYNAVESDVEATVKNSPVAEERQFFGGGRRILRDFITVLLISSLIRRRRRPFFGFPGFIGFPRYFGEGSYGYPYY